MRSEAEREFIVSNARSLHDALMRSFYFSDIDLGAHVACQSDSVFMEHPESHFLFICQQFFCFFF